MGETCEKNNGCNAIYYEDAYFLLPEEFDSFDAFLTDLKGKALPAQYSMTVLRENHNVRCYSVIKGQSMAPYFLSGYHDDPVPVEIDDPENVYPATVEVMDQAQYNAKLREVINRVCPGCLRFKPLSNRVQSLNGHFEEMTLDGVCVFRQETKPSPRAFHDHLFSFGGFFRQFNFSENDAQQMHEKIKQWFYVRYADAVLEEEHGIKTLILQCKKKELLAPVLTNAISHYIQEISGGTYRIRQAEEFRCTEETLKQLLSQENREAFRKDCKKYGVSIAVLRYDADAAEKINSSLKTLVDHFWLFPLVQTAGEVYFLVADTTCVLKELRYRAPLMQAHNASADVFDQYRDVRYQISFDMRKTEL